MKNAMESITIRVDQTEERICALEDRTFEMIQSHEHKEKKNSEENFTWTMGSMERICKYWSLRNWREGEGKKDYLKNNGWKLSKSGKRFRHPNSWSS